MHEGNIIILLIGLIFIGTGFIIVKFPMLISGYNTMPKAAREKVDIKGLSHMMRKYLIVIGLAIMVAPYLCKLSGLNSWANSCPVFIILGLTVLMMIKSRKYTKEAENVVLSKSDRLLKKIRYTVLGVITVALVTIMIISVTPASVKIEDKAISISGMYGTRIPFNNMEDIKLQPHIHITLKTNGAALGSYYKGHFNVEGIGNSLVFLNSSNPPYIVITMKKGKTVILNCKTREQTEELFDKIRINLN